MNHGGVIRDPDRDCQVMKYILDECTRGAGEINVNRMTWDLAITTDHLDRMLVKFEEEGYLRAKPGTVGARGSDRSYRIKITDFGLKADGKISGSFNCADVCPHCLDCIR